MRSAENRRILIPLPLHPPTETHQGRYRPQHRFEFTRSATSTRKIYPHIQALFHSKDACIITASDVLYYLYIVLFVVIMRSLMDDRPNDDLCYWYLTGEKRAAFPEAYERAFEAYKEERNCINPE